MDYRIEDEIDKMINELNSVDDEFVNNYFSDEEKDKNKNEIEKEVTEPKNELEFETDEILETNDSNERFSYNQILNRLDRDKISDKNPDVIEVIEQSNTPDEFFKAMEEINND